MSFIVKLGLPLSATTAYTLFWSLYLNPRLISMEQKIVVTPPNHVF